MSRIRVFTDEDVYGEIAPRLRAKGFDVISAPEVNRLGECDEAQLLWAVSERRVLLSFNVGDFARLHSETLRAGGSHAGIIVSRRMPIGPVVTKLMHLSRMLTAEDMVDRLEYLTNW
jgi:hypothetical protein